MFDSESEITVCTIGIVATRIRRFGEAIEQAHDFGIGPGIIDDACSLRFQRAAVEYYSESLPWSYLVPLAVNFDGCAKVMAGWAPPEAIRKQWLSVLRYLRSARTAICEQAPAETELDGDRLSANLSPITPPVMPFAKLALLLSPTGATDLIAAASSVEQACGKSEKCPLSEQEIQLLQAIASGSSIVDLALSSGYSERSMYRALSQTWQKMGVGGRTAGMRLAASSGWI